MIELMTLFGVAVIGSFFWLVSPELTSAYYGADLGWNPIWVGLVCATGQCCVYVFLYRGGSVLVGRWKSLANLVGRTRARFEKNLEERYLVMTALAGLTGIPPVIVMVALASGFKVALSRILLVTFVCRGIRFGTLAALGEVAGPMLSSLMTG